MNPAFELAKNFIVEGLAIKLDKNQSIKKDIQINVEPRVYYEGGDEKPKLYDKEEEKKNPLAGMFNKALATKAGQPPQINKNKLY